MIKFKKIGIIVSIVGILTIAASAALYMQPPQPIRAVDFAPTELIGMPVVFKSEGEEAIERTRRIHAGPVLYIQDAAIIYYGPEMHQIKLWISTYENESMAYAENEKMRDAIVRFAKGYWAENLEEMTIDGESIYKTSPHPPSSGHYHYFWADGRAIFYVEIPPALQEMTDDIIRAIKG
ncbi:MAG: hypothetical protein BME93_02900 [Methanosarcinales archaeon Met12]|nr:MAG: hypothetical protein BME93_02900 [Methanosarcinales archaeon Met12]